jgi:hypothetical protein
MFSLPARGFDHRLYPGSWHNNIAGYIGVAFKEMIKLFVDRIVGIDLFE